MEWEFQSKVQIKSIGDFDLWKKIEATSHTISNLDHLLHVERTNHFNALKKIQQLEFIVKEQKKGLYDFEKYKLDIERSVLWIIRSEKNMLWKYKFCFE